MTLWRVRREAQGDGPAISALTTAAFREAPHSGGNEARIVETLRIDGDLALSLVVENEDRAIIGHVACSPVTISDGTQGWFGIGPVSVIPLRQRTGIGSTLIESAIQSLTQAGAGGCVVLGDTAYYGRFGFVADPQLALPGEPTPFFQRLLLRGPMPVGQVRYARAFA